MTLEEINMREQSARLKGRARTALLGNYTPIIVSFIILLLLFLLASYPFNYSLLVSQRNSAIIIYIIANILIMLVLYEFLIGLIYMTMKIARGEQAYVRDLLFAFRNRPDRFIPVFIIRELVFFICLLPSYALMFISVSYSNLLWLNLAKIILTLLGVMVGLLITAFFSFTELILIEDSSVKGSEGLKLSRDMLRGHIGQLIYILISFIGYYILSIISFNIGFLWTIPYSLETLVQYYYDLKAV